MNRFALGRTRTRVVTGQADCDLSHRSRLLQALTDGDNPDRAAPDAFDFLTSLGEPEDPSTVWGSNCGDASAKSACAEYSADLGIFAAEQFAAVYRQSRVACSERLFRPETRRAKQSADREEHVQQAVQPQAASNAAAEASSAIQQSESHDRQSTGHVPASASVSVHSASSRPSLVSATSPTNFSPKLQLQPDTHVAASLQPPRVRIIVKPNIHGDSQLLQPVGRTPAQASAAAPTCTVTTKMGNSKSGSARGKKRNRVEHSLTEQKQAEELPVEDPDTPDLEELPPQAFKRPRKEQRGWSMEGSKVKIGDVVWAKCGNHPWWPAQVTRPDPIQLPALRETYGSAMHTRVHVRFFGDSGQCAVVPAKLIEEFDKNRQMRSANQRVARTSAVAEAHSVLHPQQRPRWR
ncbi:TPA: Histone-lysine N-methyltransferase NSD3 [Trebouxia sp. C0005]